MNRRGILRAAMIAFAIGAMLAPIAWGAAVYSKRTLLSTGQPAWTEVAWPFGPDIWGRGKAFRCDAADCNADIQVYVRPKIGFCNCATGISDDAELERLGDLPLLGRKLEPLAAGKPVNVAWMKGLSRNYSVVEPGDRAGHSVITVAFHDRCDAIVAMAKIQGKQPQLSEAAVLDLLKSPAVISWLETTLGL